MSLSPVIARVALIVVVLASTASTLATPGVSAQPEQGPRQAGRPIDGRYIVVFRDDVREPRAAANEVGRAAGISIDRVYDTVLKGFSARVPEQALAGLRRNPRVAFIDQDVTVAAAITLPTGVDRVGAEDAAGTGTDPGPGVPVAVLDTGIANHPDLNVVGGYNCTSADRTAYGDVQGHGTHVAGTIGANGGINGVAPGTPLYAVKVLGDTGSGSFSWIICGLDWAAREGITVANLSLGAAWNDNPTTCSSSSLHQAVCNAANRGLRLVVAAGNDGANTAGYVPAVYDQVTTVSALADSDGCRGGRGSDTFAGPDDTRATFSNRGAAVDIAAPGVAIESTAVGGGYRRLSGTSMASPHVAALIALGGYATTASTFGEPIAALPTGDTRCPGDETGDRLVPAAAASTAPPPRARNDVFRGTEDRVLRRAAPGVLGNDAPGAKPLTVRVVTKPRGGTLVLNANGAFSFKPKRDFNGNVSFTYRVTDVDGRSVVARVTLRIAARPR